MTSLSLIFYLIVLNETIIVIITSVGKLTPFTRAFISFPRCPRTSTEDVFLLRSFEDCHDVLWGKCVGEQLTDLLLKYTEKGM